MTKVYVATKDEYSDYHVVGVFSTYRKAARHGSVFVTTLDRSFFKEEAGAWACRMALGETTAYYSAPSGLYPEDKKFSWGDVIHTEWEEQAPEERPPEKWGRKVVVAWGKSKEHAIRAAMQYAREHKVYTRDTAICPLGSSAPEYDVHTWNLQGVDSNTSIGKCEIYKCARCPAIKYGKRSGLADFLDDIDD